MSAIFQGILQNGRVRVSAGPGALYFRGMIGLSGAGILVSVTAPIDHYVCALPVAADGTVCTERGGTPIANGPGGFGLTASGRLATNTNAPINNYHQGVPFAANGALCVIDVTPATSDGAF